MMENRNAVLGSVNMLAGVEILIEVGPDDDVVQVWQYPDGEFAVVRNGEIRHPKGSAVCALQALGNYLHAALYALEKSKKDARHD